MALGFSRWLGFTGAAGAFLAAILVARAADDSAPQPADFQPTPTVLAQMATPEGRGHFVQTYCLGCHNARAKVGGMVLEGIPTADLPSHATVWEDVIKRLGAGEMPPHTAPRHPDPTVAQAVVAGMIAEMDSDAVKHPYAGRTVIRRLNRTEYANTVRDLLDIAFPYGGDLPQDGTASGFDNIGDALSMSPLLLESYLKVARRVSDLALGQGDPSPVTERFPAIKSQGEWQEGMPFHTRGGVLVTKYFPRDGEYDLRAFLDDAALTPSEGVRFFHVRVPVKTGEHTFIVTFPQSSAVHEGPIPDLGGPGGPGLGGPLDVQGSAVRPHLVMLLDGKKIAEFEVRGPNSGEAVQSKAGPPTLARAEITGPYNAGPPAQTVSRAHILICNPKAQSGQTACARQILTTLLRRAWRRNVTGDDVAPFLASYSRVRAQNRDFVGGISAGLRDILVSPAFLFRLEIDPKTVKPGQVYAVADTELASRLSYFLWSSMPDDTLLNLAAKGRLHDPAELDRQTRRMLADSRANALIDNFAAQWLSLRDVDDARPDGEAYPEFNAGVRDAFKTETRLFLRSIMVENRSILDVVGARYTFLNDRLAALYGIANVNGPGFRRVELPADSPRGGILGEGSILMVTSHTNKTSPVLRGKWILTNLLDSPPNPPPAGVPPLNTDPVNGRVLTTREQVERHRASPVCSSCHSRMDPYGFSLENFDVMGRWRLKDDGGPVDATATTAGGVSFKGPDGLRQMLLSKPEPFVEAAISRMMTYANGRQIEAHDRPVVRDIAHRSAPGGYKFDDLVLGIVHSAPFRMKQAASGSS